jgi:hypothetical protein
MKFLTYIISTIIFAVSLIGMIYHGFWLALEIAFNVNAISNSELITVGCVVLGIISALVFDKCEN